MMRVALSFVSAMVSSWESPLLRPRPCNSYDVTSFPYLLWASVLAENSTSHYCRVLSAWKVALWGRSPSEITASFHPYLIWSQSSTPVWLTLRRSAITSKMLLSIPWLHIKSDCAHKALLSGSSPFTFSLAPRPFPKAPVAESSWITPPTFLYPHFMIVI